MTTSDSRPGVKAENEWMQYRSDLSTSEAKLKAYWDQPFSVKPYLGFSAYEKPPVKLRMVDETGFDNDEECSETGAKCVQMRRLFRKYFSDAQYVEKFVNFNSLEHKKGEDFFSLDKSLFLV